MIESSPKLPETYISPDEQAKFHQVIDPWLDSMIERHGMGRMSKLDFDPARYPFQDMNVGVVRARIPNVLIQSLGRTEAAHEVHKGIRAVAYRNVDEVVYKDMLADLSTHHDGQTLRTILFCLKHPGSNVTVLLPHFNLQDVPFTQLIMLDALSQAPQDPRDPNYLDIFSLIDQSYSYASETMTRLAWDGEPVMHNLSGTANVVKLYPPTENGVRLGVDRLLRRRINERSKLDLAAEDLRLRQMSRSRLDYNAPAGSTMEKVYGSDGTLIGLAPKKVNVVISQTVTDTSAMVFPLAEVFDDQMGLRWQVMEPHSFRDRSEFNQVMADLYETTARLAGTVVIEKPED